MTSNNSKTDNQLSEHEDSYNPSGEPYWKSKYEKLQEDYDHLLKMNQTLEDKLLQVVENFEKKKKELVASLEYEKSTMIADVNELSTKLVHARIKLHDQEEKEILHAAECSSPCHRVNVNDKKNTNGHLKNTLTDLPQNNNSDSIQTISKRQYEKGISHSPRMLSTPYQDQTFNDPNIV